MSDTVAHRRSGAALRAYQIVGVLLVGWLAGRLPQIWADNRAEESRLFDALGVKRETPRTATADPNNIAAEVAARVAAEVANNTIAQLIAAGWGPRQEGGETIIIREIPARGGETTVRIVNEQAPAPQLQGVNYDLPPSGTAEPPARHDPPPSRSETTATAAHAVASEGYAALSTGDKRRAVSLLQRAIRLDPQASQASAWGTDVRRLTKRWGLSAYTLSRGAGTGDALAASPVLGASQTGAAFTYTFDPLAKRPFSAFARIAAAGGPDGSIDNDTAEAAVGLRVQPLADIPVAFDVERRIALGYYGRDAWAARVSGGTATAISTFGRTINLEAYGEAGVVDFSAFDLYGGVQGRAATPLFSTGRMSIDAGVGMWAAAQRSFGDTVSRFDAGPSVRLGMRPWAFSAQVDYRVRAAGNARPTSGPALTIAGQF